MVTIAAPLTLVFDDPPLGPARGQGRQSQSPAVDRQMFSADPAFVDRRPGAVVSGDGGDVLWISLGRIQSVRGEFYL